MRVRIRQRIISSDRVNQLIYRTVIHNHDIKQFMQCLSMSKNLVREVFRANLQSFRVTVRVVWTDRK